MIKQGGFGIKSVKLRVKRNLKIHRRLTMYKACINIAYKLMLNVSNSPVSNSFSFICEKYHLCRYNSELRITHDKMLSPCSRTIIDMMNIRDNLCPSIITQDEAVKWLDILCTT